MSAWVIAVVATVAFATLVSLAAVIFVLLRRVSDLSRTLAEVSGELANALGSLGEEAAVAEQEMTRIAERAREIRPPNGGQRR